jgi:hypothetical protein
VPVTTAQIGEVLDVDHVRRQPWPYASSFPMERIDVDGEPPLLFKDVSRPERLPRPQFLADRRREITAYADVLCHLNVDTPAYRASVVDDERAWLFLELVDGVPLWQVEEVEVWEETARCLAALHAEGPVTARGLLRYDAEHLNRRFALAASLPNAPAIGARLAERLAALPSTFIHGEFYASNVMIQHDAGRVRVRPVDWEMAGTGPAVLDLAALTAGTWSDATRLRIEQAYNAAIPPELRPHPHDLDCARLLFAAQWIGWSVDWSPPPEHAQDWSAIAVELIERLGL